MVIIAAVSRKNQQEGVVSEGRKLADAFDENLHIVNVLKLSEFVDIETSAVRESGEPEAMEDVRNNAKQFASNAAEGVTDDFVPVGLVGEPATQVVKYAKEKDASYVVIGGRKRSPTGKAIFGSVTQSILLGSNVPVLTVIREK